MPHKDQFDLKFRPRGYGRGSEWVIATIALPHTVLADIIRIRVRKAGGRYRYRIMADDDVTYSSSPKTSNDPLSLPELIAMIDRARGAGYDNQPVGLTGVFRDQNLENSNDGPEAFLGFVIVTSKYYPDLERWYKDEAKEWLDTRLAERAAERAEDDKEMNRVRKVLRDFVERKDSKGDGGSN